VSRVDLARAAGQLRVRSERRGAVHDVAVSGELDVATATTLESELTAVEAGDADRIVIDLAGLEFIDCAGLGLILHADAHCGRGGGGRLTLLHGPPHIQRVFDMAAVADRLPFAAR